MLFGSQNCLLYGSVCPLTCILSITISRSANRCVVILCCLLFEFCANYTKVVSTKYDNNTYSFIDLKGHHLVCYDNDIQCRSNLMIFRAVSTHCPVLRHFSHGLYSSMKSHMYVATIDNALSTGVFQH